MKTIIHLIDPPTFPKGVLSLSLAAVAGSIPSDIDVNVVDLNFSSDMEASLEALSRENVLFIGIKVSSQNFRIAIRITKLIRAKFSNVPVIWGGEYPTLLPSEAAKQADTIVIGSFEPIAEQLVRDAMESKLLSSYEGTGRYDMSQSRLPRTDLLKNKYKYFDFMGIPVETSRGCDRKCTFCMVHTMQPSYDHKPNENLKRELSMYGGVFVNVIDYNIGVSKQHILNVAEAFRNSDVLGWMAEMCLESLDDEEVLTALASSRCRMIYCGLESTDEATLRSINKARTNHVEDYQRIIRKAQSFGIQVAAGVIIGLEGSSPTSMRLIHKQFSEWGIAYAKLTFLTYNPGTKVKKSMTRKGTYTTEEHEKYDGNHLTFVANGLDTEDVYSGATQFIKEFYGFSNTLKRGIASGLRGTRLLELLLFNVCYSEAYRNWLRFDIFNNEANFEELLEKPLERPLRLRMAEEVLNATRRYNYKMETKLR